MAYDKLSCVFTALGDPMRRELVQRLAKGPCAVVELAHGLPISRPAVSQHLRHLKDAGLVNDEAVGTRRIYRLDPKGIGVMRDWLDQHWQEALGDFKRFADRMAEGKTKENPK